MLYRTPRFSAVAAARVATLRVLAALTAFHRSGIDAATLDGLRDEQLRDLGISRIESKDVRFYR